MRSIISLTTLFTLAAATVGLAQTAGSDVKTGYAQVNGLKMYYDIHGSGQPLILLHGGAGATEMFAPLVAQLATSRQVITVDLQAHGRTADIDRPFSYEAMGDDIGALISYLKLDKADVMGYSLGGGVALRTAIQHPAQVRKLILLSTTFRRNGWYPEILTAMSNSNVASAERMKGSPMYQMYARIAPRPQDWGVLFTKLGDLLRRDYDWSKEVAGITAPVLLIYGDADAVRPEHMVEFFQLLGGGKKDAGWDGSGMSNSRLAILPGQTHYNIFMAPQLGPTVTEFLNRPMPKGK